MKKMRAIKRALLGEPGDEPKKPKKKTLPTHKEKINELRSREDSLTPHEKRYLNSLIETVRKETGRNNI